MPPSDTLLRIIPLGGEGEIGKNMYVFEYGDEIVVIEDDGANPVAGMQHAPSRERRGLGCGH